MTCELIFCPKNNQAYDNDSCSVKVIPLFYIACKISRYFLMGRGWLSRNWIIIDLSIHLYRPQSNWRYLRRPLWVVTVTIRSHTLSYVTQRAGRVGAWPSTLAMWGLVRNWRTSKQSLNWTPPNFQALNIQTVWHKKNLKG